MTAGEGPSERLRAICLALPGAAEVEAWGDPTWRVGGRIFAMAKRGDGRLSVWMKAPEGVQELLVEADPERFFVPPYVGPKGWIGVRLDGAAPDWAPDWAEVAALVARSHALVGAKRRGGKGRRKLEPT